MNCDPNGNGYIDASDLAIMQRSLGATAGINDVRDVDGNGVITAADIAACRALAQLQPVQQVPIPTLEGWGIALEAGLLLVLGVTALRRRWS